MSNSTTGRGAGHADSEITKRLNPEHPSFGTRAASFLLELDEPFDGARLVVVEADSTYKVVVVETLAGTDGQLCEGVRLLSVFRECRDTGLRSDAIAPMSYIDLVVGWIPAGRLLDNAVIATVFQRSLTDEDRVAATRLMDAMDSEDR